MLRYLVVVAAIIIGLSNTSASAFTLLEDFTDTAWQDSTNKWGYPHMIDGTNGWTVTHDKSGSHAAVKGELINNGVKQCCSFWEQGWTGGGNPAGLSRADLPSLESGEFEFSYHNGYGGYTFWQVELRDKDDNVAATIRGEGSDFNGVGERITVNGTTMTDGFMAVGAYPANITAAWDINADTVTVDLIDGFGGDNKSLGLSETIQNGAGAITQWVFTTGNSGNGEQGGGIELVGHWDANQDNTYGFDVDGIRIEGVEVPEPAGLVLMGIGSLMAFRRRR